MAYPAKHGRPNEYASKAAHSQVIQDAAVQALLNRCGLPNAPVIPLFTDLPPFPYTAATLNPLRHIIAIDGGYREVPLRTGYPAATVCFFQFGALTFSIADLEGLTYQSFIDPLDMMRLKQIQRLKLVLPVNNLILHGQTTLTHSVRQALYEFCCQPLDGDDTLMATLAWLLYQDYATSLQGWQLAGCPVCQSADIPLLRSAMSRTYTFSCPQCGNVLYLTDVFRLHERIDDEWGAGGILGYACTAIEQLLLAHLIRLILRMKPALLSEILFIKDGPLAFFGPTLNLRRAMSALVTYLFKHHDLYLVGIEKSGSFVEHADAIAEQLAPGSVLLLNNTYIYRYIVPGPLHPTEPYGSSTYYAHKLIFKTPGGQLYVASLPTPLVKAAPMPEDFYHLAIILTNLEKLQCDMYDSALVPIALVNQLVSLSQHPSARILQRFASESIAR